MKSEYVLDIGISIEDWEYLAKIELHPGRGQTVQIPENPTNSDIRDALLDLRDVIDDVRSEVRGEIEDVRRDIKGLGDNVNGLGDKVDKQDYKFDAYQKGIDGMVRMSITIIIATATVAVLPSLSPAITAIINAITNGTQ